MFRHLLVVVMLACGAAVPAQGASFSLFGLIGLGEDSMSFDAYDLNYDNRITTDEVVSFSGTVSNGAWALVEMHGSSLPDMLEYNLDGFLFDQLNEVVAYTADTRHVSCNKPDGGSEIISMDGNAHYRFDPKEDAIGLRGFYQGIRHDPSVDGPLGKSCEDLKARFFATPLSTYFYGPVKVTMTGDLYTSEQIRPAPVPLPASLPLLGLGLAALWRLRRRQG